jgi:hypothetical protein
MLEARVRIAQLGSPQPLLSLVVQPAHKVNTLTVEILPALAVLLGIMLLVQTILHALHVIRERLHQQVARQHVLLVLLDISLPTLQLYLAALAQLVSIQLLEVRIALSVELELIPTLPVELAHHVQQGTTLLSTEPMFARLAHLENLRVELGAQFVWIVRFQLIRLFRVDHCVSIVQQERLEMGLLWRHVLHVQLEHFNHLFSLRFVMNALQELTRYLVRQFAANAQQERLETAQL